ncbi:uncharacterized protein METZ01_LOCUS98342 [marine metagenome]|uniref:Uncharacterized protein n=1 Tax=marine metagenome TaxID=408172 RepID=A0A381W0H5_9ZZZZ
MNKNLVNTMESLTTLGGFSYNSFLLDRYSA